MGLNEVTEMGIIFEPLILLLLREPLVPEMNEALNSKQIERNEKLISFD